MDGRDVFYLWIFIIIRIIFDIYMIFQQKFLSTDIIVKKGNDHGKRKK